MEVYARELIPHLVERAPWADFTAFVNREAAGADGPWAEGVRRHGLPVRARRRVEWAVGEQTVLPVAARRRGVHLVHSLGSTAPAWGPFRRVSTIHDLNYLRVPDTHSRLNGLGMRVLVPLSARTAHRVIVPSRSTRDDLAAELGVRPERVDLAPYGLGRSPGPPTPEAELRARLDLGARPVLLTLSAKRPHKNLARLIDALAGLPAPRPVLVMPGYPTPHEDELRALAAERGVTGDVRLVGWLPDPDVEGLYALCRGMVFPSLYEGGGLPVLEAMRRGVPVASSERSSLPEYAGGAALLFDPEDVGAIRTAMARVLADEPLRARLRSAGPPRAARFTWQACADATIAGYRRALTPSA
jgi:glycosyltransferase involved in cell wall biosynthesis